MKPLEALVRDASDSIAAAADRRPPLTEHEAEVARQMQICNACRYCEGYCAVFPAMARRLEFGKADINYLANLCHNCGGCYHACQYAPPHDFAVNVPRAMARVRLDTYEQYAWPRDLGALYKRNGLAIVLAAGLGLALFFLLASAFNKTLPPGALTGNFYAVFPHEVMVLLFGGVFGFATLALAIGVTRFWRAISSGAACAPAVREASRNVLALTYLDGGHGDGCNEADDRFTLARRRFHHLTFYGFMLCFAATAVATVYHFLLQRHAPYAMTSLPVVLGSLGGIGLLVGPAGLLWLNLRRDPSHGDPRQKPMDRGFIVLLLLISASGFGLLLGRDTNAMPALLSLHLGLVMALFCTLPYGKFAHGIFRSAALLKSAIEKRQPDTLRLGSE